MGSVLREAASKLFRPRRRDGLFAFDILNGSRGRHLRLEIKRFQLVISPKRNIAPSCDGTGTASVELKGEVKSD